MKPSVLITTDSTIQHAKHSTPPLLANGVAHTSASQAKIYNTDVPLEDPTNTKSPVRAVERQASVRLPFVALSLASCSRYSLVDRPSVLSTAIQRSFVVAPIAVFGASMYR